MVGIIIKAVVGLVLFTGSLAGGLAATGRLNHEGTANIPVLNLLFPEPEIAEVPEGELGAADEAAHASPGGETQASSAAHSSADGSGIADGSVGMQGPQGKKPPIRKRGKSVINPEVPKADPHGGGHGSEPEDAGAKDSGSHGGKAHGDATAGEHEDDPKTKSDPHGDKTTAERDFDKIQHSLRSQGRTNYRPGSLFQFRGVPAGVTPDEINEAWQRVQSLTKTIEQRQTALDLRDKELQELADDISRRWKELGEERLQIEQMQRKLDTKIAKFEETVKLVRNDEVQKLKRYAETLAAFERAKAAELVEQQWSTERGQDEVLRVLEFMDKDAVNEILQELPNIMVQDVLEKRMRVSKEAAPPVGRD